MRTPISVDKNLLLESIALAEENGPLSNRQNLYIEVAKLYNTAILTGCSTLPVVTPSVVLLRVKEWSTQLKTPLGKRGRAAGTKLTEEHKAALRAGRQNRSPRVTRFNADSSLQSSFELLAKRTPERYQPLVNAIRSGSKSAAIKLNCLECSGYVTDDVRNCVCTQCPLYAFRPYQRGQELEEAPSNPQNQELVAV